MSRKNNIDENAVYVTKTDRWNHMLQWKDFLIWIRMSEIIRMSAARIWAVSGIFSRRFCLYTASLKGIRPIVAKKRVKELVAKVGLQKVVNKKMKNLSGGMKRRVGIAQAMLNNPKILILDEPTAGLDPNERIRFRNLISELAEDRLVLLSTHIVSDIEYIANEIWLLKDGKLMHTGTSEEVINSMPEKVWECCVEKNKVSDFMNKYKISNMKSEAKGVILRIISLEKPVVNAKCMEPSLEDVFLYYFGEKAGDNRDKI